MSAKEDSKAPAEEEKKRDWLLIGTILLATVGIVLINALAWFLFNKLASSPKNTEPASAAGSTSSNPVTQDWNAVLTSANSNGNFIGDFGGRGNGTIIPAQATDLSGKTWPVGRALLTYCETASECYFMFAVPGDTMPRAFNVNLYTPEFTGDLQNELQYINTGWNNNADVTWTYWTPVQ